MLKNPVNKRTNNRLDCLVPVDGREGSPFSRSRTVDISRDGIGFLSDRPVPLNEKIAIELALKPDADPVLVVGEVKWVRKLTDCDKYRIGLMFSDVIDGSKSDLEASLDKRPVVDTE